MSRETLGLNPQQIELDQIFDEILSIHSGLPDTPENIFFVAHHADKETQNAGLVFRWEYNRDEQVSKGMGFIVDLTGSSTIFVTSSEESDEKGWVQFGVVLNRKRMLPERTHEMDRSERIRHAMDLADVRPDRRDIVYSDWHFIAS